MLQREAHAATALSTLQRPHRSRSPAATKPRHASPPYAIPLKHSFVFQNNFYKKFQNDFSLEGRGRTLKVVR